MAVIFLRVMWLLLLLLLLLMMMVMTLRIHHYLTTHFARMTVAGDRERMRATAPEAEPHMRAWSGARLSEDERFLSSPFSAARDPLQFSPLPSARPAEERAGLRRRRGKKRMRGTNERGSSSESALRRKALQDTLHRSDHGTLETDSFLGETVLRRRFSNPFMSIHFQSTTLALDRRKRNPARLIVCSSSVYSQSSLHLRQPFS